MMHIPCVLNINTMHIVCARSIFPNRITTIHDEYFFYLIQDKNQLLILTMTRVFKLSPLY
jgi:hypothetical protein